MGSSRLAVAAVGLACVAAAAGGSYVATRQNVAEHAAPAVAASDVAVANGSAVAPGAVTETEGVVGDTAPTRTVPDTSVPAVAPAPAPAPRSAALATAPPVRPPAKTSARARVNQPPAVLDRSWPSASADAAVPVEAPPVARDDRPVEQSRALEPPPPTFDELTIPADSVIGLETDTTLSSERARVEDRVEARVARDVRVGGRVAIPEGTRALGTVVVVERGGKLRERARLGIRFHTLALADGTRLPVTTETIYRYGDAPGNGSAAKIGGGAVAGAILGAIIGGGKGAAIGATTGAAGGGAAVMTGDRSEATFPAGGQVTARILSPVTVTVEQR